MGKFKIHIIVAITALLVGIVIGWQLVRTGTNKTNIQWKFGDQELNIDLQQDLVDASTLLTKIFSEEFSRNGAINWLKKNQKLYYYSDPDLVVELSKIQVDELISLRLQELCRSKKGPWAYQWDTVLISIPKKELQPQSGFANVCEGGKYLRNDLEIFNIDQSNSIKVTATGKYACPDAFKFPDIQLNADDAIKLLGTSNFSKYEKGIAVIIR